MKRNILLILALIPLFLGSCVTRYKCIEKYPDLMPVTVYKVDTVTIENRVVEVVHDTIIKYQLKDSIVERIIRINTNLLPKDFTSDTSFLRTEYASSWAVFDNQGLHHKLQDKDTTILIQLDNAIRTIQHQKEIINTKESTQVVVEKLNFWQRIKGQFQGILIGFSATLVLSIIVFMKYGASFINKK